jgi:DNA (cytosine-5)-methyltransferase 1
MSSPIGIELFCGCGGMSTGFLDAGLCIKAGFDLDRKSIEAYNYNHIYRDSHGFVADLASASASELLTMAGLEKVDFIIGGPPCQPFSIAGKRRGNHDSRAGLIGEFLRIVTEVSPRAVFFENVPNLATIDSGMVFDELVTGLRRLGYSVKTGIVAAADFGVPQIRRRLLLVGALDVANLELPDPTHACKTYVSVHEAIGNLPLAADYGECRVFNHEPTEHSDDMVRRFGRLLPGKREPRSFHDRLHPDRPSYTLRAGSGNFSPLRPIHYEYNRVITVRESARLQTFSDDFIWPDWIPRLQQYRQVGNAVPPLVARRVAEALARQLQWELKPQELQGIKSDRPKAITLSDEERRERRRNRTRGASLGLSNKRSKR